jgi:hypothetical protein
MTGPIAVHTRLILPALASAVFLLCAAVPSRSLMAQAAEGGAHRGELVPGRRLEGKITDASTGAPVPAVNVRILGTPRGTVSNADGLYRLPLESGDQTVVFIHLAYERDTIRVGARTGAGAGGGDAPTAPGGTVAAPGDLVVRDIALRPSTIVYPEVLVLAEDPAIEIIRKAIENKHRWMDLLKTYRFDAYTRQVIEKDTSVASITEAFTTGWVLSGDTLRERVVQKRQTANVPMEENFAAVRRLVNFNDDRITLFNVNMNSERRAYTFTGPTAPDALDNYDYRLLRTRRSGGIGTYEISMEPKTKLRPLFHGTITIADRSFAVVGVDLEPNETFAMPFVKDIELRYRQQFALYDSLFWMPADIRIDGGFTVSILGFGIPRVGFRQVSSIYNYELNVPVPDSVIAQRSLTVDSSTTAYDSTYWRSGQVVPLTAAERTAYGSLDSTQTLEKQFRPGGVLGRLSDDDSKGAGSLLDMIDARFTRVEGLFLGAGRDIRSFIPQTVLSIGMGYGFSEKRWQYTVSASVRPLAKQPFTVGGEAYRRTDHTSDGGYYGAVVNSIAALFDKSDYNDYYRAQGFSTWAEYAPGRRFLARVTFTDQDEGSLANATDYSFISRGRAFRPNPAITDGTRRSVAMTLRFGLQREALDIIANNNLEVTAERSSPRFLSSDFDYTRVSSLITYTVPLFATDLLFPASLRLRVFGGKGFGDLPPQRSFSADARLAGLGPFGVLRGAGVKEYAGDAVAAVAIEQNFRSLPFLALNLPFLYRNGVELIVHGAVARAWSGTAPLPGGLHTEAGIGINRILDLLRVDLTWRFREPSRFFLTLSAASFL